MRAVWVIGMSLKSSVVIIPEFRRLVLLKLWGRRSDPWTHFFSASFNAYSNLTQLHVFLPQYHQHRHRHQRYGLIRHQSKWDHHIPFAEIQTDMAVSWIVNVVSLVRVPFGGCLIRRQIFQPIEDNSTDTLPAPFFHNSWRNGDGVCWLPHYHGH